MSQSRTVNPGMPMKYGILGNIKIGVKQYFKRYSRFWRLATRLKGAGLAFEIQK